MFRGLQTYKQGAYNCTKQMLNFFLSCPWQKFCKFRNMQEFVF